MLCSRGVARCIASPLAALPTVPQAVLRIVLPAMDCIGFTARDAIHLLACSTAQFTPNGAPARHTLWTCSGRSGSSGDSHEHVLTSAVSLQRSLSSTLRSSLLCIEQDSVLLRTIPCDTYRRRLCLCRLDIRGSQVRAVVTTVTCLDRALVAGSADLGEDHVNELKVVGDAGTCYGGGQAVHGR